MDESDRALDTIADLLRTYGNDSFDTDHSGATATRESCERWASKILVGAGGEEATENGLKRDFGGLRRHFKQLRRSEVDSVTAISVTRCRASLAA